MTEYSEGSIEDTRTAYDLLSKAQTFIQHLWEVSEEYETVTEAFLNPENISTDPRRNVGELESVNVEEASQVSHKELEEYSSILSSFIEEEQNIRNSLERIDSSSLSENLVIHSETIDRDYFADEIEKLLEEYKSAEKSIWNADIRLKKSDETDFNLIDRRLKSKRREVRREKFQESPEVIDYLFAD